MNGLGGGIKNSKLSVSVTTAGAGKVSLNSSVRPSLVEAARPSPMEAASRPKPVEAVSKTLSTDISRDDSERLSWQGGTASLSLCLLLAEDLLTFLSIDFRLNTLLDEF